jgi:putative FmdB family regulatory protein
MLQYHLFRCPNDKGLTIAQKLCNLENMPLYEYECPNGHIKEDIFPSSEKAPKKLKCGICGNRAKRIMSKTHWQWGLLPLATQKDADRTGAARERGYYL